MSSRQNNANVVSSCNQRLTALQKHLGTSKTPIEIGGQTFKPADLVEVYQTAIDTRATLVTQRAEYDKALAERDDADIKRVATDGLLKKWVDVKFGIGTTEATEFGFNPRKSRAPTAEKKAEAVLKRAATRKARGTRGKRQKADIKGTIDAPTAPAEPATTTTAASPAASVPNTSNSASASH